MEEPLKKFLDSPRGYADAEALLVAALQYESTPGHDRYVFLGAVSIVADWARTKARTS